MRLRPNKNYPPSDFFDAEGRHRGISADYVELLEQRLGIEFDLIDPHRAEALARTGGKGPYVSADVVTLSAQTPERARNWSYTEPYLEYPAVIIASDDAGTLARMEDLDGREVGVVASYSIVDHMQRHHQEVRLVPVENTADGLRKVSFGLIDAFLSDLPVATYTIEREGIANLRIAGDTDYSYSMSFAVRKDWPELLEILQKGLRLISSEERRVIFDRWVKLDPARWYASRDLWLTVLVIVLAAICLSLGFLLWNRTLAARVNVKTEQLRLSEVRYRTVVEDQTEFVVRWQPDGKQSFVNRSYCEYLGEVEQEVLAANFWQIIREEDLVSFEKSIAELTPANPTAIAENAVVLSDGSTGWVQWSHRAIFDPSGRVLEYQSVGRDISAMRAAAEERRELHVRLRQTQKLEAIGTLAGGIAHDFNNILAAIVGHAELACTHVAEDSRCRKHLEQILEAGERASALVRQIHTFSRVGEVEFGPIEVRPLLKEVLGMLRASISHEIEIVTNFEQGQHVVSGDATHLHQVLMNLITNAIQAMSDGGGVLEIKLRMVEQDGLVTKLPAELPPAKYLQLSVSDTGAGIARDDLERVFEPFFTTKEVGQGVGMGLAVVHGIVTRHGGAVRVQSVLGEGSVFDVFLPISEGKIVRDQRPKERRDMLGQESILLVDDETIIATLGQQALSACGYQVEIRTSSIDALNLFRANPAAWDLVITDQRMPKMTGLELAKEMLSLRADLPILLCSGFSGQDSKASAEAAGLYGFLQKPFSNEDLVTRVRSALDRAAQI